VHTRSFSLKLNALQRERSSVSEDTKFVRLWGCNDEPVQTQSPLHLGGGGTPTVHSVYDNPNIDLLAPLEVAEQGSMPMTVDS
jgi:hypothetical protein